ncbi:pickpocket protein 28 [Episyrphus balteatus]|uniref:pickpocket protein 28 n=1 Tax=Episyrphus balteatus TaxID=286459 RepID=UPI002485DC35|nr:pickpocket protein 28 [Episyrphus balteatus]
MEMKVSDPSIARSTESVYSDFGSSIPTDVLSDVPSDVIIESRIKYGTKLQMFQGFMMEYSKKSSLHGVRYIFQRKRPLIERLFWAVMFISSVIFSCVVIRQIHIKFLESPVIVSFDETLIPINRVPFPTITICPESKMETEVFNFSNVIERFNFGNDSAQNITFEEMEKLSATLHICDLEVAETIAAFLPKDYEPNIGDVLREIAVSKNITAPFCKWSNRFYFCEHIFSLVATDDGICYQFNGMQPADIYRNESYATQIPDDIEVDFNKNVDRKPNDPPIQYQGSWSIEEGYINQTEESYPLRTIISSARTAFVALLQGLGHNLDYKCRSLRQGYKVYLNSPQNVVFSTSNYFLVRHKQELIVQIYPVYTTTSKGVRKLNPEMRQCFFNSERYLRFFKHYSESNCQFECLTNFTIAKCGCVKFSMPQPEGIRVCSHSDIACYHEAEDDLLKVQQMEIQQSLKDSAMLKSGCNCLPGCTSLSYNFDISQARMAGLGTIQATNDSYDEHPDFMWSRLTVYFKEKQFTAMKRSELYAVTTLIANYGGVLSLSIGFSLLSIVELLYFITIRLKNSLNKRSSKAN